jgi:protein SCO1/2
VRRLLAALGAVGLLAACSSSGSGADPSPSDLRGGHQVGDYLGAGLVPPQPRPNFTLTDTSGAKYAFGQQTAGRPTLLFFGYTNCPDECPTTLADIRLALRDVAGSIEKNTVMVFVSTDVVRDTGPVMARYLKQFSAGTRATWVGLHGTQAQIDAAQAAAHVTIAEDHGETHSLEVLLYGPDNYAPVFFLLNDNLHEQIAHDLALIGG